MSSKVCDKGGRPPPLSRGVTVLWGKRGITNMRLCPSVGQYVCNVCVWGWMLESVCQCAQCNTKSKKRCSEWLGGETEESTLGLFKASLALPTQVCCIVVVFQLHSTVTCNKEDNSQQQKLEIHIRVTHRLSQYCSEEWKAAGYSFFFLWQLKM